MGLFSRKKQDEIIVPAPTKEELYSLAESVTQNGIAEAINNSIQKQIDNSQYFQAYENADDGGNFFGTEFNIRVTAGRIKATYTKEPWIFATATLIARTLSSLPLMVVNSQTGEPDLNHPLNKKLNAGNRIEGALATNWKGYLDLVLGGNFFLVFNETYNEAMQTPVELVSLKVNQTTKMIESLLLYDNTNIGAAKEIPYKQCVHFKYPNPFNPYYGLSLFTAASRPILLDRYKNEFEMAFYLRGATNSGVIETTEDINRNRMERLMRTFEAVYTGRRNWWRTIFLPKGAKWVQSGLTMSEMQHLEGLRENRLTLLAVLGIPPSQVGIVQDVNRATAEVQERNFWSNTIKPLAEFVAGGWNNSYLVKTIYGGQVKVVPDYSNVQALQGSLTTKGEQAKSVENYLWIDEIRADILGYDPLPDGAGAKFVSEVKPAVDGSSIFGLSASADPAQEIIEDLTPNILSVKAQAISSQERIERKLSTDFLKGFESYIDLLLDITVKTLSNGGNLQTKLTSSEQTLATKYIKETEDSLLAAMERGFSFANSQAKTSAQLTRQKVLSFNATDQQAIDALRAEQQKGKREALIRRAIDNFIGFNQTRSNEILDLVAAGIEEGKTTDQVAATIRADYREAYKNQAFTIARTELLTAISQGIKWNHDVLSEVFSEVKKQWLHVGDVGSNPDARDWHLEYELLGAVASDYKYGGKLDYPRDPAGGAEDCINCRCSLVSVIPSSADSNADVILDRL